MEVVVKGRPNENSRTVGNFRAFNTLYKKYFRVGFSKFQAKKPNFYTTTRTLPPRFWTQNDEKQEKQQGSTLGAKKYFKNRGSPKIAVTLKTPSEITF